MTNFSHDAARDTLRYRNCTFVNGAIYSGGATPTFAECLAVREGMIAHIGTRAGLPQALRNTEEIDLRGRMIVPGFTDSHAHPVEGFQLTCDGDLGDAHSFDAIAHQVRECAALHPQRSWVMAGNVALEALGEQLNRASLDTMVRDRPLLLIGHDVHSGCLNTAALRALGVSATTPDPEGGIYERDEHGEPTGFFATSRKWAPTNRLLRYRKRSARPTKTASLDGSKRWWGNVSSMLTCEHETLAN
jgi:predicted amidohydrolase YtcJ